MAAVSIDIPSAATPRIKAMTQVLGPRVVPDALPAGKQPADWTNAEALAVLKAMLRRFVLDLVKQVEADAAADAARNAATAKVDADGLVT